jgi:hypothetical protein
MRLVKETEAHVVVRLLLLFLLLLLSGRGLGSTTGSSSGATSSGTTTASRWDGCELGGSLRDELCGVSCLFGHAESRTDCASTYLVDVLALQLRDELLQALVIGLDTDGLKDLLWCVCKYARSCRRFGRTNLDVAGGRRGVSTKAEEKVCCEVLHCVCRL